MLVGRNLRSFCLAAVCVPLMASTAVAGGLLGGVSGLVGGVTSGVGGTVGGTLGGVGGTLGGGSGGLGGTLGGVTSGLGGTLGGVSGTLGGVTGNLGGAGALLGSPLGSTGSGLGILNSPGALSSGQQGSQSFGSMSGGSTDPITAGNSFFSGGSGYGNSPLSVRPLSDGLAVNAGGRSGVNAKVRLNSQAPLARVGVGGQHGVKAVVDLRDQKKTGIKLEGKDVAAVGLKPDPNRLTVDAETLGKDTSVSVGPSKYSDSGSLLNATVATTLLPPVTSGAGTGLVVPLGKDSQLAVGLAPLLGPTGSEASVDLALGSGFPNIPVPVPGPPGPPGLLGQPGEPGLPGTPGLSGNNGTNGNNGNNGGGGGVLIIGGSAFGGGVEVVDAIGSLSDYQRVGLLRYCERLWRQPRLYNARAHATCRALAAWLYARQLASNARAARPY